MRLRNVAGSREAIAESAYVVPEAEMFEKPGKWADIFGNNHPIHIEIGMGKGQFIHALAKQHPEINYVGVEKYSSVLIRAIQKMEQEELPRAGEYNVILLTDGTALCITKTTKVSLVPYRNVSADHAFREGEGDRSISYWRKVHEAFFTEELASAGLTFTENMTVVCEEFQVVFR